MPQSQDARPSPWRSPHIPPYSSEGGVEVMGVNMYARAAVYHLQASAFRGILTLKYEWERHNGSFKFLNENCKKKICDDFGSGCFHG